MLDLENNVQEVHCSRERSRAAWEIIEKVPAVSIVLI